MKIYTKKGDAGETGLVGGSRIPKDDQRLRTYGTVDELNAVLGVVLSETQPQVFFAVQAQSGAPAVTKNLETRLLRIQGELFQLGAELATPQGGSAGVELLGASHTAALEAEIDAMEGDLAPLKSFILPGGSRISAMLHLARTVSRRAERELVAFHRTEPQRPEVLEYLNRLSDYLFVCARHVNHASHVADIPWNA